MSLPKQDVLVVGGGVAGVTAALAAVDRARGVTLVRRAPGATALSSGAIDVAPDVYGERRRARGISSPGLTTEHDSTPVSALVEELALQRPWHPYALVGADGRWLLEEAIRFFTGKMRVAGLDFASFYPRGPGHLVVDGGGSLRRVGDAQLSQVMGEVEAGSLRVGVLRLKANLSCDMDLVLGGLRALIEEVEPIDVTDWPVGSNSPFLKPTEIGKRLDNTNERSRFVGSVSKAARGRSLTHLVMPPIAGLARVGDVIGTLAEEIQAKPVEILGGEASLPGLRFHQSMERALETAGVKVRDEEVKAGASLLEEHDGPIVLATGRFIGGGIRRSGDVLREHVFGLPLHDGFRRVSGEPVEVLTKSSCLSPQSLFSLGCRVDTDLCPLDLGGSPVSDRLFCAGSIIGGYDPHADHCGMGVAILTGFIAGRRAADWEAP